MSGTFVAIVGSSGVGKDTVMAHARARMGNELVLVRRVVTRTADGGSEDHDTMSVEQFSAAEAGGQFALAWEAHGLRYGLPITLENDLRAGKVVMANLSRSVIPYLLLRYPTAIVVEIVADRDIIAGRLAGRGREDEDEIRRRLDRSVAVRLPPSTVRIDNSGPREIAGEHLVTLLTDLVHSSVRA